MVELIIQQEINSCHATSLKTEQAIKHAQAHFLGGSVQKFELPTIPTMYILEHPAATQRFTMIASQNEETRVNTLKII